MAEDCQEMCFSGPETYTQQDCFYSNILDKGKEKIQKIHYTRRKDNIQTKKNKKLSTFLGDGALKCKNFSSFPWFLRP